MIDMLLVVMDRFLNFYPKQLSTNMENFIQSNPMSIWKDSIQIVMTMIIKQESIWLMPKGGAHIGPNR